MGRHASDPRTDRDGETSSLSIDDLALSRMNARADLDPDLTHSIHQVERAANGTSGAVERRIEAVACRVVLDALPSLQSVANDGVVTANHLSPGPVARRRLALGRPDDVGEEDCPENGRRRLGGSLTADEAFDGIDDLGAVPIGQRVRIAGDELEFRARDP